MNSIGLTGFALVALGLAGFFSTAAATALIPAVFGLIFVLVAVVFRRPRQLRTGAAIAAGVAALGILAVIGAVIPRIIAGTVGLNAPTFANVSMALICGLYLAYYGYQAYVARTGPIS